MNIIVLLCILYLKLCLISCETECEKFQTCGGCIGYVGEKCAWCSAKDHIGRRCNLRSLTNSSWCKDIYDPTQTVLKLSNKKFSDGHNGSQVVQFRPQSMKIQARTNVPINITLSYKPAQHYPLDVYYLLDSSDTMWGYKVNLYDQGVEIYNQLSLLTNNVQLGVGSFVEKPALPYVDIITQKSYSFKHHQKMTNDVTLFSKALEDLKKINGSNNDKPQANFDALMQSMICTEEIGWRPNSHRIILLSTDATYHSAGDGKFVGAIKPNDMKCHLEDNEYKMSLTYDYPSVGQINKIATETNTRIIFAADQKFKYDYKALQKKIKNVKYVPLLAKSNVLDMILTEYEELTNSLQLEANLEPFMSLILNPDCTIKDNCRYKNGEPVDINATLTFTSCPENGKYNYDVRIGPASIKEKLTLQVEVYCQCDCEKKGEKNSEQCSKEGTYQCGICDCNPGRYGDGCNCTGTTAKDLEKCTANIGDPKPCSNRGICSCGKCICEEGFSGDFCQFNDNSCVRPGGVQCSGHGRCTFGKCLCDPEWRPDDCRCPVSDSGCIAPYSKELCSGRGECVCGKCVCRQTGQDGCDGEYCDECGQEEAGRCAELKDYAHCNLKEQKAVCDEKYNFTDTEVILTTKAKISSDEWYLAKMWCRNAMSDGKILVFRYHYPKTSLSSTMRLIIQNELDKPPVAKIWVTVGSVIGAMVLIGIITIVAWKLLVDLHDKREYDKFYNDSKAAGFDVQSNPLYQPPASNFQNPVYREE